MAINVSQSFHRTSANAVDDTLTLTKAEMLAVNDNLMPSKYLTVCQDDGFIYLYDKSATPNGTTGKFSKFEGGGSVDTSKLYSTDDTEETALANGDYVPFYDTSASGKKKTLWSNVKSALKTYFDTLYSTVKTRGTATSGGTTLSLVNTGDMYTWNNKQNAITAGTNITISGSTINSVGSTDLTYSTSERAVGKWIDNKTIYQKTISTVAPTVSTSGVDTISNISAGVSATTVVSIKGVLAANAYFFPDGWYFINANNECMHFHLRYQRSNNTIDIISSNTQWNGVPVYITIQYTK